MTRTRRSLVYCAAWTPYAASYFVLFRSFWGGRVALLQTAYNIAPAMLLGIGVVRWARLAPWIHHRRRWFYPLQLASALAYSTLWYCGVVLLGSLGEAAQTHHIHLGYFSSYAMQWQFFSGLMIYGNIVGIMYVSEVNERLRQEERRRELAESLQTSAELAALRAHVNPHFLFNTLTSIMALAGPAQPRTMQAIAHLAAMLRYTLRQNTDEEGVSLRQELEFTEQYLALESLRFGERLHIHREITPAALLCRLPPLTLQPLVENAIRHGIGPRAGEGRLCLRAYVQERELRLEVQDDGLGNVPAVFAAASGLGLRTVRQRLDLFSHGHAVVGIQSASGCGCTISISLPQEVSESARAKQTCAEQSSPVENSWMAVP